ncbi:MAG: cytochrome c-type biogenesis protein CcmH [Acidobacteriota bacterium]
MLRRSGLPILLLLLSTPLARSADVRHQDVVRVTSNIVCTCGCPPTLVSKCSCTRAAEMTGEVKKLLAEGKTDEEIYDYYVSQFGAIVLAAPKAEGFNLLGWVFPFVALLIGAGIVVVAYRRLRTRETPGKAAGSPPPLDEKYRKLLERELKE